MTKFEVTFREVLVGVIILLLAITVGFFISSSIEEHYLDKNQKYYKALKVKDKDTFNYGIKTSIGNMLAYGEFKANEPVTYDDIKGEYFYVSKTTEKYTMHTRTVSYKCGKSTCTRVETYWTWDFVSKDSKHTKTFSFMDNSYPYKLLKFNGERHIDTQTFGDIRYIYHGIPVKFNGSWFSKTQHGEMTDNEFYLEKPIKKLIEEKESQSKNIPIVFWVIWIFSTLVVIVIFVAMDNKFLNGK